MPPPPPITVTGLFIYPVKALRGLSVTSARVDALGFEGDRRFLIVDPAGRFLTQRTHPRLALITAALSPDTLTLSAEGGGAVAVRRAPDPAAARREVSVWSSGGLIAEDCGAPVAAWLSDFLGAACGLVRVGPDYVRPVAKPGKARAGDVVSFADAYPFLVIGEASLADLNDRLIARGEEALPMDRFRPNLVVAGGAAFAEDGWQRFRIGDVAFRAGGPCARCTVTTVDQRTAVRGVEPLRTLAGYRRDAGDPTNVNFGQNLIHETKAGVVSVGDRVDLP